MNEKPVILMVEDEPEALRINARMMARRGYEVLCAGNCAAARACWAGQMPDLLVLDVMLPDGSGFDLCEAFRAVSDHPVIFLTGKNGVADKVDGLGRGGDYYLTKPCDPDELAAVAERLLARHRAARQKQTELSVITRGPLTLEMQTSRALLRGEDIGLTAKEFALLRVLVQSEGRELSSQALYEAVWGAPSSGSARTIRTHILNLRRKLGAEGTDLYDITATYGKGYAFLYNG